MMSIVNDAVSIMIDLRNFPTCKLRCSSGNWPTRVMLFLDTIFNYSRVRLHGSYHVYRERGIKRPSLLYSLGLRKFKIVRKYLTLADRQSDKLRPSLTTLYSMFQGLVVTVDFEFLATSPDSIHCSLRIVIKEIVTY
jgi:hypothetical protein